MNQQILTKSPLAMLKSQGAIRVWGIDLGTTNSTIAEILWSPDMGSDALPECRCLEIEQPTRDGVFTSPIVPSVLVLLPNGSHWVGEGAKRLRTRPQDAALAIERSLFFDTKNEMGLRKTYYRAPERHNHASKIAGHILEFIKEDAERATGARAARVCVTVPASFQLNQRSDTLKAAECAGITLGDHDLLDEPTAALLDYLFTNPDAGLLSPGHVSRGVVFDFGGGTCDVSVVEIEASALEQNFKINPLAVSRYHRLGGGDLDAAIVHEHLLPALMEENGLSAIDLKWEDKKRILEPQLLGTAEALKIALCTETDRLQKFGRYESSDRSMIVARQPALNCSLGKRQLTLREPSLTASQWEEILEPFLEKDHLYSRETEYRLTQSVFAPLQDALDRAGLSPKEVSFCLLVGGSSLIPQVREAVQAYFQQAHTITFPDYISVQTAVARGAAWHAFFLATTGKPIVQPVVGDTIALLTGEGEPYQLIPAGSSIPFPVDGSYVQLTNLAIPRTMIRELVMKVVTLSTRQPVFEERWRIDELVNSCDPITVQCRLLGTQAFELLAFLANNPDSLFQRTVQNPLVNVVNPNQVRLQIEEREQELREQGGGSSENRNDFVQLARWYAELQQHEKALSYLSRALRLIGLPDSEILNLEGIYAGELGDYVRQERAYREADKVSRGGGAPIFNLALSFYRRKKLDQALEAVEQALQKDPHS
ncbi:MAG TPA: hypothetical protein DCK93_21215, partial [Blastocatellia bacterium]|nr:hypothetical protein [Blastocatellia bacterium]